MRSRRVGGPAAMGTWIALIVLVLASAGAVATDSHQQVDAQTRYIDSQFGDSIDIDGDVLVTGAPLEDSQGDRDGAAYVFEKAAGTWSQEQHLDAGSHAEDEAHFGQSVALDGDTLAVGAESEDAGGVWRGAVYIFEQSSGAWSFDQRLDAGAHVQDEARFGSSIALDGDTLAVAADKEDGGGVWRGAAYIFEKASGSWSLEQRLDAGSHVQDHARFGSSIALDGDTLAVGAQVEHGGGTARGAAYTFERSSGIWSLDQRLDAGTHAQDTAEFGSSIALDGDTLAVGAERENNHNGAIYVFARDGDTWSQQQRLESTTSGGEFGKAVDVEADLLVVTEWTEAAYLFTRDDSTWTQQERLDASSYSNDGSFGRSVEMEGDHLAVGAPTEPTQTGGEVGALHVWDPDHDPFVDFDFSPSDAVSEEPVEFTDESLDDYGTASWSWDFDDGQTSTEQAPTHSFVQGSYNVCLTAEDHSGQGGQVCKTVDVGNAGPNVDFTFSPAAPTVEDPVAFTDESEDPDGAIQSWEWDFGDGSGTSTSPNPSYQYDKAHTYSVCLTVTGDEGIIASGCENVPVGSQPPTADFSHAPSDPTTEDAIQFTDASSDPDGTIQSRSWDFGDGNTSTAVDPTHTFAVAGDYEVCLEVTDDTGALDETCRTLAVASAPTTSEPSVTFSYAPGDPSTADTMQFTEESSDPDGSIASLSWDFDDGNTSTDAHPTHGFAEAGTYEVCLTVEDDDGNTAQRCQHITVEQAGPTISEGSFADDEPRVGESMAFNAPVDEADGSIETIEWDFGDGTTATGANPSHSYAEPGTYEVTLTVRDDEGEVATQSQQVTVQGGSFSWTWVLAAVALVGIGGGVYWHTARGEGGSAPAGSATTQRREDPAPSRATKEEPAQASEDSGEPAKTEDTTESESPDDADEEPAGWATRLAGEEELGSSSSDAEHERDRDEDE